MIENDGAPLSICIPLPGFFETSPQATEFQNNVQGSLISLRLIKMEITFCGPDFAGGTQEVRQRKSSIEAFIEKLPARHFDFNYVVGDPPPYHAPCVVVNDWHGESERGPWITCLFLYNGYTDHERKLHPLRIMAVCYLFQNKQVVMSSCDGEPVHSTGLSESIRIHEGEKVSRERKRGS